MRLIPTLFVSASLFYAGAVHARTPGPSRAKRGYSEIPQLLIHQESGLCLSADPQRRGDDVVLERCTSSADQMWSLGRADTLRNLATDRCIAIVEQRGRTKIGLTQCSRARGELRVEEFGDALTIRDQSGRTCFDADARGRSLDFSRCSRRERPSWLLKLPHQRPPSPPRPAPTPSRGRPAPVPAPPPAPKPHRGQNPSRSHTRTLRPMDSDRYSRLLSAVDEQHFSDDKRHTFLIGVEGEWLTTAQLARALRLFNFSNDQVEIVAAVADRILDPENREDVVRVFTFSSDKQKVREMLR